MSDSFRLLGIIVVVAVVSLGIGIPVGKYLEREGTGYVNAPAYDSGWITPNINDETIIEHDLGTTEVLVYVLGNNTELNTIHQFRYGGDCTRLPRYRGVMWYKMNNTHISLWTYRDEVRLDYLRVQI